MYINIKPLKSETNFTVHKAFCVVIKLENMFYHLFITPKTTARSNTLACNQRRSVTNHLYQKTSRTSTSKRESRTKTCKRNFLTFATLSRKQPAHVRDHYLGEIPDGSSGALCEITMK